MTSRGVAPMAFRARTTESSVAPFFERDQLGFGFRDVDLLVGHDHGLRALRRERVRLRDVVLGADLHGQVAVRDRGAAQAHLAADDDGAGALVDDDARLAAHRDRQRLEPRHQVGQRAAIVGGHRDLDARRVEGQRRARAHLGVDRVGDARRVGEIRRAERQQDRLPHRRDCAGELGLDDAAGRHAADGEVVHLHRVAALAAAEAAERERALGQRVDGAVGAAQRRRQQRAALQAARVADRGGGDVETAAAARERRQFGGDEDGGDVFDLDLLAGHEHAEALEHVGQRLRREHRLAAVAALVEADDEAVADERHRRRALQRRDVAQADGRVGRGRRDEGGAERGDGEEAEAGRGETQHQNTLFSTRISQPGLRLSFIRPRPK